MRLTVDHETVYRFDGPRRHVLQSQRLQPSVFDGQTVADWQVVTEGGLRGAEFRDGAGDVTWCVRVAGPVETVKVAVHGTVETSDLAGVLQGHREKVSPRVYTQSTRATRSDKALTELTETALAGIGPDADLDRAHALAKAVHSELGYATGATDSITTAAEALAAGQGVCQDHAHVLIAAAHVAGLPARYVAGYLFASADDDAEVALMAEASHAWAELHVRGLGWVGFDAANDCCPDARYIRLCSGRDAEDAAPIRGLTGGLGAEALDVTVAVRRQEQ